MCNSLIFETQIETGPGLTPETQRLAPRSGPNTSLAQFTRHLIPNQIAIRRRTQCPINLSTRTHKS